MKNLLIILAAILFYQSNAYAQVNAHEHFSLDFIPEDFVNVRGFIFGIVHTGLLVIVDPSIRSMTFGILLGGITPFIFIPLLEKYVIKSKHHIVVGDHDDIKKDLDNKHNH
jgi:hypothetical protein